MTGYDEYKELRDRAVNEGKQEDIDALWDWFEEHGYHHKYNNKEHFDVGDGVKVYPISERVDEIHHEVIRYKIEL